VTVPPEKRDPNLAEHLKAEWPAILAWAIEGCLAWQRDGLAPPESVLAATANYLEGQDAIAAWIDECCERDSDAWESRADLYASFKAWAERTGEFVLPQRRFLDALETRGVTPGRRNTGGGFFGLQLGRQDQNDRYWDQNANSNPLKTNESDRSDTSAGYHRHARAHTVVTPESVTSVTDAQKPAENEAEADARRDESGTTTEYF